jgi:hypothetical protein
MGVEEAERPVVTKVEAASPPLNLE